MAGNTGTRGPVLQSTQMQSVSTTPNIHKRMKHGFVFVDPHNPRKTVKVTRACKGCQKRKVKCDGAATGTWPCNVCIRYGDACVPPSNNMQTAVSYQELPPMIPFGEDVAAENTEKAGSGQQIPADGSWTVYSPNVLRGNLDNDKDYNNDVGMNVGWNSEATAKERGEKPARPWMSEFAQQPSMFPSGWDAEAIPRASDHSSHYPHPSLSLPHPTLSLDFRMSVTLNPSISVGPTPLGYRNWISFAGASWFGSLGSGIVLPGGQDSQLIIADGSAKLEANYILQTFDSPPAQIIIKTHGWRTGPPKALAQLADPELADKVDPNSYKFRLFIDVETVDERYRDRINCGMWVGSGMRRGAEVIYDAYRLS